MKLKLKATLLTASMVLLLLVPFVFNGCNEKPEETNSGEGFAIYPTRENTPPSQMEILSRIAIADKPVITLDDVISYDWNTHTITLTKEAFESLINLEVPTTGKSFIVCVNKSPVYWGAFWVGFSSQSFDGITIMTKPPFAGGENIIQISLGYPSGSFYDGEDPRSNPAIMASLEKAGKLK